MLKNTHIFSRLDKNLTEQSNLIIELSIDELSEKLNQFQISENN